MNTAPWDRPQDKQISPSLMQAGAPGGSSACVGAGGIHPRKGNLSFLYAESEAPVPETRHATSRRRYSCAGNGWQ